MSPFTILILIAIAAGAFGYIDEETELNFDDELSSSEDIYDRIGESDGKIVQGDDAEPGQFPHQVAIRNNWQLICGGSILNRLFVLTTAHCTHGTNISLIVGATRTAIDDGVRYQVRSVYQHPGFVSATRANDIGLIRTVIDIVFNNLVSPVTLPVNNVPEGGNLPVYFSGWGLTANQGFPARRLQFKDAITLNRPECIDRLGVNGRLVHENTLCVHNPMGRGACLGDIGGPLVTPRRVQVGISSWVIPCAQRYPDVYVNVFSHIEYIKATIRANWNSNSNYN